MLFLTLLTIEFVRHVVEIAMMGETPPTWADYIWPSILMVLILFNIPVVGFQIMSQCKSLCKKPVVSKADY